MSIRKSRLVAAMAIVAVLSATACDPSRSPVGVSAASGSGNNSAEIRLEIPLISIDPAIPDAKGKAKFRDKGGEQELEIQVENLPPVGGTPVPGPGPSFSRVAFSTVPADPVEFFVDGVLVGTSAIDALGNARLNINSDVGDSVPAVQIGSVVVATLNGVPVVEGVF